MESTLELFQAKQAHALDLLGKLEQFIRQGSDLGVPIDPSLSAKLDHASQTLSDSKLKIALIGGFSEGKTSIAAAWMERLDKASMRISQQESSNEISVYQVEDDLLLIDTPGLFGFKERNDADLQAVEKYKDITRKYVSEAHLVLYVMNSTNPIKESHRDELHWLFRTLDLLPRTVFVLSRFDEVADVEDEGSYQESLKVKRANVQDRLRDALDMNAQEVADTCIVAVAANPFDLGTEHWLANLEQFKSLSHISSLQAATLAKIKDNGGAMVLVDQARKSVIRDILHKELPVAKENDDRLGAELEKLKDGHRTLTSQLAGAGSQLSEARTALREFIVRYFSDLILRTQGLTLETFPEFFEREIGAEGIIVTTRLQNEFDRQLNGVAQELGRMRLSFDSEVSYFNDSVLKFGKQGVNYLVKGNLINNTSILAARDGVVGIAKTLGMDLSKALKFKPWGAVNLAKGVNGALAGLGLALEAWDSYERIQRQKEFESAKVKMVGNFEGQRKDLMELVNDDYFIERFFPEYAQLQAGIAEVAAAIARQEDLRRQFHQWRVAGEFIEGEFSVVVG
ncbi:LeoA/HP0731 family dynamin-like GTPase [Luteibacter yeojuensis]|uniref:Labile enterotoxin output A n=1 Tax=Luteibacter yeojuensis TaxID=345309 RepID=A0A0F3KWT7_9GAMM|nr:LeoA/HP0731 family dynamin-like GTPase [Luteibacter yeojuensis]KJV35678.1 labile enterotoxin output A [Luteibacter yeojuensis]